MNEWARVMALLMRGVSGTVTPPRIRVGMEVIVVRGLKVGEIGVECCE